MQVRRFALAALLVAALGALGWFALRAAGSRASALDAPASAQTASPPRASAALESSVAASSGAPDAQRSPILPDSIPTENEPIPPGHPGPQIKGLIVRVLSPSSEAERGAQVTYLATGPDERTIGGPLLTDVEGCVRLVGGPDTSFVIRAGDPTGQFGPAYAFDKHLADGTVELRLEATVLHTLLVTDEQGAPVERFAWRLLDERQYGSHVVGRIPFDDNGLLYDALIPGPKAGFAPTETEHEPHPAGRAEFRAGSLAFVLQVDAEGFVPAQAGPFAAEGAPGEIHVVLQRAPGLRGRVVLDGQGVAGATVKLFGAPKDHRPTLLNGFPSRILAWVVSETESESDGSFLLPLRTAGEYVIQAAAQNKASAEFGPRRFSATSGAEGIELVLAAPGAIEGRLLLAAEDLERYRIIGGSCGDGQACSAHTDEEGRFRFENLRPGSWLLMPTDQDLVPGEIHSITTRTSEAHTGPRAICEVFAGQTAHVDIDLRTKAMFVAEVRLAGWEGASRSLRLDPLGVTFSRGDSSDDYVKPQRMRVDQPGTYLLHLALESAEPKRSLMLEEALRLEAGDNAWTFESAVGELVLVNTFDTEVRAWLRCELGGTRVAQAGAKLGPHEERRLGGLPVGMWKSSRRENGNQVEQDSVMVTAGASARLEWK